MIPPALRGGGVGDLADEDVLAVYADESRPRRDREAAFHVLVDRFQRRVFAVCRRVVGDPGIAEEATQEVFIKLARSADTFRGEAQLSTWLYAVARNVATDRVRHEARRPSTPVADVSDAAGDTATADDEVGARAVGVDLGRALAQLDDISRDLLLLVAVEGLSYAEAAEAAGMAVGTVKSRVSRARVRLGELLSSEDVDDPSPSSLAGDRTRGTDTGAGSSERGPPI